MTDSDKISKAVTSITANHPLYKDMWICDESWVRIVNMHFKDLKDIKNMRDIIKRWLNMVAGAFDEFNVQNIYMWQNFKQIAHTKLIRDAPLATTTLGRDEYLISQQLPLTLSVQWCINSNLLVQLIIVNATNRSKNRCPAQAKNATKKEITTRRTPPHDAHNGINKLFRASLSLPCETLGLYWSSPEAAALFGFNYSVDDDVVDLLEKVIEKLDNAIEHFIGSLSIPPTQQSKKQFILHQIRPESSGCNRARVLCNIWVF